MILVMLKLLATLFFVAMNAFFVLSEFAIVKVRKTRLEELANQNNRTAQIALDIVRNLDSYLSAVQLGITLASLALGWIGEPALAYVIKPLMDRFLSDNLVLLHTVSIIISFTIITFMHVVLGELVPKSIAIQKTEKVVLMIAWPMKFFHKITYPIVYLFDHIASFTVKQLGIPLGTDSEQAHSEEELRMLVNASHTDGILDDTEGLMLDNMLTFSNKTAREVMIPRTDMICVYLDESYDYNLQVVLNATYTRFPLCRTDKDNVVGMIHLRDLLENEAKEQGCDDLAQLMREVIFVPETTRVTDIMQTMRLRQIHLAVVIDEYGGTAGIITLEDILEEIVGDINDEYDLDEAEIKKTGENIYEINGTAELSGVAELLNIEMDDQDETVAGFVFSLIGHKAEIGDAVQYNGYTFTVTSMEGLRITKINVSPTKES